MSAGRNMRRGYYIVSAPFHSAPVERTESPHTLSMILAGFLVLVMAAIASDEVIASSVGRELGVIWSDATRLLMLIVRRGGL